MKPNERWSHPATNDIASISLMSCIFSSMGWIGILTTVAHECSSGFASGGWNGTPNASAKTNMPNTLANMPPARMIDPSLTASGYSLNLNLMTAPSRASPIPNPRSQTMNPKTNGNVMNRTRVGSISSYFGVDTRFMKNSKGLTAFGFLSSTGGSSCSSGGMVSTNARPQQSVSRAV